MNLHPDYLLNRVEEPEDIKTMSMDQLEQLAAEMRTLILERVSTIGGHLGPDLGIVELAIAYHYVFNSPTDKVIWDVSHNSYPHKMLTGRKLGFLDPDHYQDISGFTAPDESDHDFFKIGHTSTSVALAVGEAEARDLKQDPKHRNIVAVIGDGSLSGGLAFEAFNNASKVKGNLIIVVNDNEMSIDDNQGGLYQGLAELRATEGKSPNNLFTFMGLDYRYIEDGNDLPTMIQMFKDVQDIDHPIVLHIHTLKGKGYQPAIDEKFKYHWRKAFDPTTGEDRQAPAQESYNQAVVKELLAEIDEGQEIAAINAAIPGAFGLKDFQAAQPDRYFDVGIAEQASITTAVGMAEAGIRPVVFENSTFLQRGLDQLIHDVALNSSPIVMVVVNGSISSQSATHQGTFDISYISSLPNIEYLAPTSVEEMVSMLRWAIHQQDVPVVIRQPAHELLHRPATTNDYDEVKYEIAHQGQDVALMAVGGFWKLGEQVQAQLKEKLNIDATLINPISVTNLDYETLHHLPEQHDVVVTIEDGNLSGGFGETIARYFGPTNVKVLSFGAPREFADAVPLDVLYNQYHLTPQQIVDDIQRVVHTF